MPRPPAGQVHHPPARLSSHTKAKLEGRLTDPSPFRPRLSVRLASRRRVDTLILCCDQSRFGPLLFSGLPPSSCLLTKPFPFHIPPTHRASALYQRRPFTEPFAVLFSASPNLPAVAVSGRPRPLSASSRARNRLVLRLHTHNKHDSSIKEARNEYSTSWCLCSPSSLHALSRGVLTPGPSAWPRRLLNQPARHPACLDCLARSTTGTFRSAALLLFWKHDRQSRPAIATASASSSKHHSGRISSAAHRHDCGCDPRLSVG